MVSLSLSPRSPRSVATPANPEALNPGSPNRDINAIVEDAAKRFEEMDDDLKSLVQDMKNYQKSMMELNENRLKVCHVDRCHAIVVSRMVSARILF